MLLLCCAGCATPARSVSEAFPPARVGTPWVLQDRVWSGAFDEATDALGRDAGEWGAFNPQRVWLARYCHEEKPALCLTARCFAFESSDQARRAFEAFRPPDAKPFQCGEEGCWTEIGVLYRWGRLVCDVFGQEASWGSEVHSSVLAGFIAKRMPPGAPDDPR